MPSGVASGIFILSDYLWPLVIAFYFIGAAVFLFKLLQFFGSVRRRLADATNKKEVSNGIQLVSLSEPIATHTFLHWIFFNAATLLTKEVLGP